MADQERFDHRVVTLKLDEVCHLCGTEATYTDNHSSERNVGSDDTDSPFYLQPADQIHDLPVVIVKLPRRHLAWACTRMIRVTNVFPT